MFGGKLTRWVADDFVRVGQLLAKWGTWFKMQYCFQYTKYMNLSDDSKQTPFVIDDIPGFKEDTTDEELQHVQTEVMKSIIIGKFTSGDEVNYNKITPEELAQTETKQECAVCVFFVIDITRVNTEMMEYLAAFTSMKDILDFVQRKDIKAAFLLTKCDQFNSKVERNPKHIYMSKSIEKQIRIVSENFNTFSVNRIFPIVKATDIIGTNTDLMAQSLMALEQVMGDISSNLKSRVDVPANINLH